MTERKDRSRLLILGHIMMFPERFKEERRPQPGSLVSVKSPNADKWYLSWLFETYESPSGDPFFLLESIEDGEKIWWTNTRLDVYDPNAVKNYPDWRWTDKQHEFHDLWIKTCDDHFYRPLLPKFLDTGAVHLSVRIRWTDTVLLDRWFDDWQKVTEEAMTQFYEEAVAKGNAEQANNSSKSSSM